MFRCIDRFGPSHPPVIGDTARFPLHRLGDEEIYPRTWEVRAFGGHGLRHCCIVQRRHDGLTRCISMHWFRAYADPCLRGGAMHDAAASRSEAINRRQRRTQRREGIPAARTRRRWLSRRRRAWHRWKNAQGEDGRVPAAMACPW